MIDITIDNNQISVDSRLYHSFNSRENLSLAIQDIIERCLYSGESISLWVVKGDSKHVIQEWVNPHVSSRFNRRFEK